MGVSANLDVALQELMDFVSRDYIMSWYKDLCKDDEYFQHLSQ